MYKCNKCGSYSETRNKFCPECGNPMPMMEPTPLDDYSMSLRHQMKHFYREFASGLTKASMVLVVIIAVLSIIVAVALMATGLLVSIFDIIIMVVLLCVLVGKKNWIAALLLAIYGVVSLVLVLVAGGSVSGLGFIIFGFILAVKLRKLKAAHENYKSNGVVPNKKI